MIPKVYLDLDVLSYAAGLPEEDGKFEATKKIIGLAKREAIKLVISWTAIRTSLRLSGIPRETQQFYEEVFRSLLEAYLTKPLSLNLTMLKSWLTSTIEKQ